MRERTAIRFDAVFFDFDGVLVESADLKTDAFRDLFAEFGADVVARCVAHHTQHAGISRVRKIQLYHKDFLSRELSPAELDVWTTRYSDMVEHKVVTAPAVAGAVAFLQAMQGESKPGGPKLFVISGTPEDELKRIVAARGWGDVFDEVHGSPRLKPEIIDDIMARTGIAKDRVLFVGDAMTDYDAAHQTGVAFLGRVAPHHDDPFPPGTQTVRDLVALHDFVTG